jgi:regulation of enolase protein 1 (concanavalin A-like superfamily)
MATEENSRATRSGSKRSLVLVFACSALLILGVTVIRGASGQGPVGVFEGHADVGITGRAGSASYDAARHVYSVTGAGADMWGADDAFHFVWRKVSGDVTLSAGLALQSKEGHEYRKAGLMIRQGLGPHDAYGDAIVHGNGRTSLQYRVYAGGDTSEITFPGAAAESLRLERHGNTFALYLAGADRKFTRAGSVTVDLHDPVYVGLVVCSHDSGKLLTAVFSHVEVAAAPSAPAPAK